MSRRGRSSSRRCRRRLNRVTRAATPSQWPDLPPDLLGDISRRLHDATDFTRLHAVCTAWRDALPTPLCRPPAFLPWLLCTVTACEGAVLHSSIKSSRRSRCGDIHVANPPGPSPVRNWLASMDGTAAWLLTADEGAGLMDLLTGARTPLPAYDDDTRRQLENPRGMISSDGTVLLYDSKRQSAHRLAFMATFLRPGDVAWTQVKTTLDYSPDTGICFSATAAYHDGKILVCADVNYWCILTPDDHSVTHRLEPLTMSKYYRGWCQRNSYFLEFQGQLLWVSVMVKYRYDEPTHMLSLVLHALEEEDKMRWTVSDGASLGDQVLFLGSHASFAMDAARLGVDGGCAYFIFTNDVLRYNFVDGEVSLVENLPPDWPAIKEWDWLLPQPTIASVQEIRKRLGLQQEH
ncbi:hypothetical protein VPH35_126233 [Triticum aestivum]